MSLAGTRDTIAAIATPPGRGGIAVVRISGPLTTDIARRLLGRLPAPRTATRARFTDGTGTVIDDGLALRFDAPHSFTGEDVIELQGHGGVVVSRMVLDRVCELGARAAKAGEFTLRAFLNDRIDLAQAEAIADLVDSATAAAARCARRSLSGEFSRTVEGHRDALVELRAFIEASIDLSGRRDRSPGLLRDRGVPCGPARCGRRDTRRLPSRRGAARWRQAGDRGCAERGEVEPAQPPCAQRHRDRDRHSGHDARRGARTGRDCRHSVRCSRYRGIPGDVGSGGENRCRTGRRRHRRRRSGACGR